MHGVVLSEPTKLWFYFCVMFFRHSCAFLTVHCSGFHPSRPLAAFFVHFWRHFWLAFTHLLVLR